MLKHKKKFPSKIIPPLKHRDSVPKETSFTDCFKQNPGIIFGLEQARATYFKNLDEFQFCAAHHLNHKNSLFDNYLSHADIDHALLPEEQKKYLQLLNDNPEILRPGGKDPWAAKNTAEQRRGAIIRRTCKLLATCGLYPIYFILDHIDMKRVCSKKIGSETDVSITG